MTLAIPYWWSKSEYDVCNDELRGGWRCLWFRFGIEKSNWNAQRFIIRIGWGIGPKFKQPLKMVSFNRG